jgi:hypothetical protein
MATARQDGCWAGGSRSMPWSPFASLLQLPVASLPYLAWARNHKHSVEASASGWGRAGEAEEGRTWHRELQQQLAQPCSSLELCSRLRLQL